MKRIGRSTVRTIYWGTLLCLFMVLMLAAIVSTGTGDREPSVPPEHRGLIALAAAFWAWVFFGRPVAYLLAPLFVATISCPGCGEEVEAVQVWDCACGFHDFREKHVLTARCPSCGDAAGHIDCPRCGCTILFW